MTSCKEDHHTSESSSLHLLEIVDHQNIEQGRKIFEIQCARCHGMYGSGGSAPSLDRKILDRASSDRELVGIIQNGIPGTEMPGSWLLSKVDAIKVASYVRSLGDDSEPVAGGNVEKGRLIFQTKGSCQSCHIVQGKGGSLGADLTRVGSKRSPEFLRKILLEPGFYKQKGELTNTRNGFVENLVVEIETLGGEKVKGFRLNEDAFSIQIRGEDNGFYSYRKSDLRNLEKVFQASVMPSVRDILDNQEVDDLVAYLLSLKS